MIEYLEHPKALKLYNMLNTVNIEIILNPWFAVPSDRKMRTSQVKKLQESILSLALVIEFEDTNPVEKDLYNLSVDIENLIQILDRNTRFKLRQKKPGFTSPFVLANGLKMQNLERLVKLCRLLEIALHLKKGRVSILKTENNARKRTAREDLREMAQHVMRGLVK